MKTMHIFLFGAFLAACDQAVPPAHPNDPSAEEFAAQVQETLDPSLFDGPAPEALPVAKSPEVMWSGFDPRDPQAPAPTEEMLGRVPPREQVMPARAAGRVQGSAAKSRAR